MIVPGAYGNHSIKWLQRVFLTNSYQSNDTYALKNNDVESPIKTCRGSSTRRTPSKRENHSPLPAWRRWGFRASRRSSTGSIPLSNPCRRMTHI